MNQNVTKKENLYTVKTINMYKHLCKKRIYPVSIEPNVYIPKYVVWKYANNNELHIAMQEYRKEK